MRIHYKFIRCLAYTIEIIILYILQNTPYLLPPLMGARPVLVVPAMLTVALLEDEKVGLGFGIFTGLLLDMSAGSILGFHAMILGFLGYFIGILVVNLVKTNLLTALLLSAAAVFILYTLDFTFFFVLKRYEAASYAFQNHYLPIMLHTFIPTPLLYFFNKAFALGVRERD